MRDGAPEDPGVEHVRDLHVTHVRGAACHLLYGVEARVRDADYAEIRVAGLARLSHGLFPQTRRKRIPLVMTAGSSESLGASSSTWTTSTVVTANGRSSCRTNDETLPLT